MRSIVAVDKLEPAWAVHHNLAISALDDCLKISLLNSVFFAVFVESQAQVFFSVPIPGHRKSFLHVSPPADHSPNSSYN